MGCEEAISTSAAVLPLTGHLIVILSVRFLSQWRTAIYLTRWFGFRYLGGL